MRRSILILLCLLVALPASLVAAAPAPVQPAAAVLAPTDGPNLLVNPGFESPYVKQCCQTDLSKYLPNTPIDEVQVAAGWLGWWLVPDSDGNHPSSLWHRPEWREANCGDVCANRVRSGGNAQKYFTFFSVHEAGMYQRVSGITPGARLRFAVYMQGWSTNANYGSSEGQASMGMRVGIDPFGGSNPFSSNIIWSTVSDIYDAWGLYTVEAQAQAGTVTVFTRSAPTWALQHNDIYIDDASLVVVSGTAAVVPATPAPTTGASSSVAGGVYVVQPGDNYYRIARRFGITLQALLAANPTARPNLLYIGTQLIIPGVTNTGTAVTPTPAQQAGSINYVVQRGDNLWRLSVRFGTTVARIKTLNKLVSDIIYIGQVLIIAP